ncbi:MAG: large conductance mechanosensitive channel protein MscL [Cyanobacteria bacterium P01_C01_bin.120]
MTNRRARNRAVNSASGFFRDFQDFLMRGNVVDLAVAVVIGGAFQAIIASLVGDIITPAILNPALQAVGADDIAALSFNGIKYGLFLAAIINFVVIAFVLFILIRLLERAKRQEELEEEAAAEPTIEEKLNETLAHLADVVERKI